MNFEKGQFFIISILISWTFDITSCTTNQFFIIFLILAWLMVTLYWVAFKILLLLFFLSFFMKILSRGLIWHGFNILLLLIYIWRFLWSKVQIFHFCILIIEHFQHKTLLLFLLLFFWFWYGFFAVFKYYVGLLNSVVHFLLFYFMLSF